MNIRNSYFSDNACSAITIYQWWDEADTDMTYSGDIQNNYFYNNDTAIYIEIDEYGGQSDMSLNIENNHFESNTSYSLYYEGYAYDVASGNQLFTTQIINNHFENEDTAIEMYCYGDGDGSDINCSPTITNNFFDNVSDPLYLGTDYFGTVDNNIFAPIIRYNSFITGEDAIYFYSDWDELEKSTLEPVIEYNLFHGFTHFIYNGAGYEIDAQNNYWGINDTAWDSGPDASTILEDLDSIVNTDIILTSNSAPIITYITPNPAETGNSVTINGANLNTPYGTFLYHLINLDSDIFALAKNPDRAVDLSGSGEYGTQELYIYERGTGTMLLDEIGLNFTEDLNWENFTYSTDTSTGKSLAYYPGGYSSLPGIIGSEYSLFIPFVTGHDHVGICPNAQTGSEVNSSCSNVIYYTENDSNVEIVNAQPGINYWKVTLNTLAGGFGLSDNSAPTGSFLINNGATYTQSQQVTLTISAEDSLTEVTEMRISNNHDLSTSSWEPYQTSKDWTLSSILGTDIVYMQFRDAIGNESSIYNKSITISSTTEETTPTEDSDESESEEEVQELAETGNPTLIFFIIGLIIIKISYINLKPNKGKNSN